MRILLTGATGFIGSFLLRRLLTANVDVGVLVRPGSDTWRIDEFLPKVRTIVADLSNLKSAEEAVRQFAPELVCHLAWKGVRNQYRNDPIQTENLNWSLNLLGLAHKAGCQAWIGLGSQSEYGPWNKQIDEETPTRPTTLYGVTKLCTFLLLHHLCTQFDIRLVWLRLFSTYGPMDDRSWMVPSLILTLLRHEQPALTEGTQRWDYLHVTDVADAIYRTAITPSASGVFNLGSGEAGSIRSIAERIRNLIDPDLRLGFGEIPYRPDQVMHLQADITRLRQATGWSPQVSLDEGLRQTVAWFRENQWRYEK